VTNQNQAGTKLCGRFVLIEKLGAGGYGEVWRARDELRDTDIALKVLYAQFAGSEAAWQVFQREFTLTARDYRFSPDRIEVGQDDLVKLTVQSADVAYSLTIDAYRLSRRIPAGGSTTLEFRADQAGTFDFYSNMTNDPRHGQMKGQLVVRPR